MRLVKGISKESCLQLVEQRPKRGFSHIIQVKNVGIAQHHLEALASANAFTELSKNRYATRWSLMDAEPSLPLFINEQTPPLYDTRQPSEIENVIEDYTSTTLSLTKHPIQILREARLLPRHTPANQLIKKDHKKPVSVIGIVNGRQRPGTSKGVTFITLEDDTGNVNVIVWLATAHAQKQPYLKSKILKVNGILERGDGGVTHIIAGRLEDLSYLMDKLNTKSRNFH